MNAAQIYKLYIEKNYTICTDSRSKEIKNSIFFAIKGDYFDGNDFAEEAIHKGAKIAIVDNPNIQHESCVFVQNTLETLQVIACMHRERYQIPIIAITGSNGKTTTKDLIKTILSSKYNTLSTKGNLNNHIGLPLSLLSLRDHHEIAILEMGANHIGEIRKLCEIAKPTYGIITNIGSAHIGEFGGMNNIIKAKNELFNYLKENAKSIIYNDSDKIIKKLVNNYNKAESYTIPIYTTEKNDHQSAHFRYRCTPFISIDYTKNINIQTKILGKYNINNIMSAIKTATLFKISDQQIQNSLANISLKNNRSEFIQKIKNDIILDAYNANPTSMSMSILNFIDINMHLQYKKMLFILGDMLELGVQELEYHQKIVNLLEKNNIKECILVGNIFQKVTCKYKYIKVGALDECKAIIEKSNIEGYSILIKGSRKLQLEKVITKIL